MALLSGLLDFPLRQPASCVIEIGAGLEEPLDFYPLLKSLEVAASRDEAAAGTMIFEDRRREDGLWMVADSEMLGRWTPLRIHADFVEHREEVFRGYVKTAKPNYPSNGGETTFEVEFQDESLLLDREHLREIWGAESPQSDLDILTALAAPQGLSVDAESEDGQSSRSLSQDGTPIKFLRDRAKANGYELIFREGSIYFGLPRLDGEAQPAIMIYAGKHTNCTSFTIVDDGLKPNAVSFDRAPAEEGAEAESETVEPDFPVLGRTPAADEGAELAPFVWRMSREGDETEEEMRARAQALANENSMKLRATGELDGTLYGHVLQVAGLVRVDGSGDRYGGLYYVDKVTHTFSPEGYKQAFELMRNATGDSDAPSGPLSAATSAIGGLFG